MRRFQRQVAFAAQAAEESGAKPEAAGENVLFHSVAKTAEIVE